MDRLPRILQEFGFSERTSKIACPMTIKVRSVQAVSDHAGLDVQYELRTLQHQNPKWKIFIFSD